MIWVLFFLSSLFAPSEALLDRKGETKKGKKKDTLWLVIATAVLIGLSWWLFDINPFSLGLLVLGWRVLIFDYLVNILLYRNKVIENPGAEKWWGYMGQSTHWWDQLLKRIPWKLRLFLRLSFFVGTVVIYWYDTI